MNWTVIAGIDAWQVLANGQGICGIASRVQWGNHESFTVRYATRSGGETEYQKRLRAIETEGFLPPQCPPCI